MPDLLKNEAYQDHAQRNCEHQNGDAIHPMHHSQIQV